MAGATPDMDWTFHWDNEVRSDMAEVALLRDLYRAQR